MRGSGERGERGLCRVTIVKVCDEFLGSFDIFGRLQVALFVCVVIKACPLYKVVQLVSDVFGIKGLPYFPFLVALEDN